MEYIDISEGLPTLDGGYIVVYRLTSDGEHYKYVHALRVFKDGKWALEDSLDTSTIVAYAGPIKKYEGKENK